MADVIVIGGGFAGLSAATALVEHGVSVHLVEARPQLGGRATSFRDPTTGERIDNGQHVLACCYVETLAFLRRIGTLDRLRWPSTLRLPMIDERGRRSVLVLPPLPAPLHLIAGVLAWDALDLRERVSILRLGSALRGQLGTTDAVTVRQWLCRHGQSDRLCEMLWEPLALAALNQSIDVAGAASFLTVLSRMFQADPSGSTLLMPAVPLDALAAVPAASWLQSAGSDITTNTRARVVISNGRASGVLLRDQFVPANVVIAAVPWFALAELFDSVPAPLDAILSNASALGSSPIVTVDLWFADGQGLDEDVVGLPLRTFQWVFDKRRLAGSSQS